MAMFRVAEIHAGLERSDSGSSAVLRSPESSYMPNSDYSQPTSHSGSLSQAGIGDLQPDEPDDDSTSELHQHGIQCLDDGLAPESLELCGGVEKPRTPSICISGRSIHIATPVSLSDCADVATIIFNDGTFATEASAPSQFPFTELQHPRPLHTAHHYRHILLLAQPDRLESPASSVSAFGNSCFQPFPTEAPLNSPPSVSVDNDLLIGAPSDSFAAVLDNYKFTFVTHHRDPLPSLSPLSLDRDGQNVACTTTAFISSQAAATTTGHQEYLAHQPSGTLSLLPAAQDAQIHSNCLNSNIPSADSTLTDKSHVHLSPDGNTVSLQRKRKFTEDDEEWMRKLARVIAHNAGLPELPSPTRYASPPASPEIYHDTHLTSREPYQEHMSMEGFPGYGAWSMQ